MGWRVPGALPQVEKREYARLIAQGITTPRRAGWSGSTGGPGNGGDTAARSRPASQVTPASR
jgi:hypothetical protein